MWEFIQRLIVAALPSLIGTAGGAAINMAMAPDQPTQTPATINYNYPNPQAVLGVTGSGSPVRTGTSGGGTLAPGGPAASNQVVPGEAPTGSNTSGFRTLPGGISRTNRYEAV